MELNTNPYPHCNLPPRYLIERVRINKARQVLGRRTTPNEKGYSYTMGYANCVGRWTGGKEFPRFSGSSYNRKKRHEKNLPERVDHLIKVASKITGKMSAVPDWQVSRPLTDLLRRRDHEAQAAYDEWLRVQVGCKISDDVLALCDGLHTFSTRSRGKVKDKATAFYRSCPGSRVFLTLTFIAAVKDEMAIALLNSFLTVVRTGHKNFQYLWVAERQHLNTHNLHFHVIINKRLPVRKYNALWVLQQYHAGLRGRTKYGTEISVREMLDRYENGTMQKALNPLDVKKIRDIGGLAGYLTKYISKAPKGEIYGCAPWHCSRGVSRLFTKTVVSRSAFSYCTSFANYKLDKSTGEVFEPEIIRGDWYIMVYMNNKGSPLKWLGEMEQMNKWLIAGEKLSSVPMSDDIDYRKFFLCNN